MRSQVSQSLTIEAFALHGNDDTTTNSNGNNGYVPIRGDVLGISGTYYGRDAFSGSIDYAHSISAHETAGDRAGNALALETSLRLRPASISAGASYVEKAFHSPGNPYLFSDALLCHSSISSSPLPMLSATASYQFGRTGMHPDSATQTTELNSSGLQLAFTPDRILSLNAGLTYAHKQGSGGTAAPLDNNTVTYTTSVSSSAGSVNATLSYSCSDENDRASQARKLGSRNTSLQCSYAPNAFLYANGSISYSNTASGGDSVETRYVTTYLSTTVRLNKTGSNSVSVIASYTSNATTDKQTDTDGLTLQCTFITSLGLEGTRAPRIHMTAGKNSGRDFIRHTMTSNQLQLSLSLGWTF
jgi:hypothetical protein